MFPKRVTNLMKVVLGCTVLLINLKWVHFWGFSSLHETCTSKKDQKNWNIVIWLSFQSPMDSRNTSLHPFCRFLPPKSVQKKCADIQTCSLCLQPCITPSLQVPCLKFCWFCVVVRLHKGTLLSDAGC